MPNMNERNNNANDTMWRRGRRWMVWVGGDEEILVFSLCHLAAPCDTFKIHYRRTPYRIINYVCVERASRSKNVYEHTHIRSFPHVKSNAHRQQPTEEIHSTTQNNLCSDVHHHRRPPLHRWNWNGTYDKKIRNKNEKKTNTSEANNNKKWGMEERSTLAGKTSQLFRFQWWWWWYGCVNPNSRLKMNAIKMKRRRRRGGRGTKETFQFVKYSRSARSRENINPRNVM